jgi:hypothetical protein
MSLKEIENILAVQTATLRANVKIVSPDDVGQNYMLRIDPQPMSRKQFTPMIAYSQANSEDRTLARVVVSPYLLGCIQAVTWIVDKAYRYHPSDESDQQGWYIHDIDFEYALKPNSKLVYDANLTDEHWLIRYNENTINHRPRLAGKMFVAEIRIVPEAKSQNHVYVTFHIEVTKQSGLSFNKKLHLDKGFHAVTVKYLDASNKSITGIEHSKIDESIYHSSKSLQSSLETRSVQTKPLFSRW